MDRTDGSVVSGSDRGVDRGVLMTYHRPCSPPMHGKTNPGRYHRLAVCLTDGRAVFAFSLRDTSDFTPYHLEAGAGVQARSPPNLIRRTLGA